MSEYQTLSHAKVSLKYHMIFSTKYRRKILNPIRESVLSAFKEVENRSDGIKILCVELDKDHIHLLIRFKPRYSIEQVVRRLKQVTTYLIWLKNEEYATNGEIKNPPIEETKNYLKKIKTNLKVYAHRI